MRNFLHRKVTPLLLERVRPHWHERQFIRKLLQRLNVDCVLDVGANAGTYAEELRLIGYRGLILSFEPDPAPFQELEGRSKRDPHWHAYNVALGSAPGQAAFNIMARSEFNSFRAPTAAHTHSFDNMNRIVKTVTVEVDTLTSLLPTLQAKHGFVRPYLKMDTQGFDLEVFRGAEGVLDRIVALQSEVAVKPIYEDIPGWRQAIAQYEAAGFELAGLYPVNPWDPELVEFDCFMVAAAKAR